MLILLLLTYSLGVAAERLPCPPINIMENEAVVGVFDYSFEPELNEISGSLTCQPIWRVARHIEFSKFTSCPSDSGKLDKLTTKLKKYGQAVCMPDYVYYHDVLPRLELDSNGFPLLWSRFPKNEWLIVRNSGDDLRPLVADLGLFVQLRVGVLGVNYGEIWRVRLLEFFADIRNFLQDGIAAISPDFIGREPLAIAYESVALTIPCETIKSKSGEFVSWYNEDAQIVSGYIICTGNTAFIRWEEYIHHKNQNGCLDSGEIAAELIEKKCMHTSILPKTGLFMEGPFAKVFVFQHQTPHGISNHPIDVRVREEYLLSHHLVKGKNLRSVLNNEYYVKLSKLIDGQEILVRVSRLFRDDMISEEIVLKEMKSSFLMRNIFDTTLARIRWIRSSDNGDFALIVS